MYKRITASKVPLTGNHQLGPDRSGSVLRRVRCERPLPNEEEEEPAGWSSVVRGVCACSRRARSATGYRTGCSQNVVTSPCGGASSSTLSAVTSSRVSGCGLERASAGRCARWATGPPRASSCSAAFEPGIPLVRRTAVFAIANWSFLLVLPAHDKGCGAYSSSRAVGVLQYNRPAGSLEQGLAGR